MVAQCCQFATGTAKRRESGHNSEIIRRQVLSPRVVLFIVKTKCRDTRAETFSMLETICFVAYCVLVDGDKLNVNDAVLSNVLHFSSLARGMPARNKKSELPYRV